MNLQNQRLFARLNDLPENFLLEIRINLSDFPYLDEQKSVSVVSAVAFAVVIVVVESFVAELLQHLLEHQFDGMESWWPPCYDEGDRVQSVDRRFSSRRQLEELRKRVADSRRERCSARPGCF